MTKIRTDTARSMIDNAPDSQVHIVAGSRTRVEFVEGDGGDVGVVYVSRKNNAFELNLDDAVDKFNMFVREYVSNPKVEQEHANASSLGLHL